MKRLTTDDEKSMFYCFNLFYAKDNEIWVRGGGPEPEWASVVYELQYDSSLSHKTMKEVAWILFKALMKEDLIQRMHEDPVGPGGDPRHPVTLVCKDEVADMDSEKWNWIMSRFLRSERDGH